jgi:LPXTG-motif cell wall-anchored protein
MRHPRFGRFATLLTAAGAFTLAIAAPASATSTTDHPSPGQQGKSSAGSKKGGDPRGANGTVKIDDVPADDSISNEPHVGCDFAVKFFNFDNGQHANIVFTVHPPTGSGTALLRRDNVLVSKDPAGGGKPDPDEVFTYSASQLGLAAYTPHPKQGYHVKLTVEIVGAPGAGKHKVFWVGPCAERPSSPSKGGGNGGGYSSGGNNGGGSQNGGGSGGGTTSSPSAKPSVQPSVQPSSGTPTPAKLTGGSLPTTGTAIGSIVALGLGLVAAGAAVLILVLRRRGSLKLEA